jgi:hypothetical protein
LEEEKGRCGGGLNGMPGRSRPVSPRELVNDGLVRTLHRQEALGEKEEVAALVVDQRLG